MISVAIGLACGLVGLIIGSINSQMFAEFDVDHAGGLAFLVGFLVGILLSNIQMAVVGSAVNTVIVCFAEAPAEFQANHPELSQRMRESWSQAYPGLSI
jgi:Plasma-membrane choline transporter